MVTATRAAKSCSSGPVSVHAAPTANTVVFITRASARERRLHNFDEVLHSLREAFNTTDFVLYDDADYSLSDTITLFSGARFVLAPHGAGLTNLMFSPPDTHVIEFLNPPPDTNPCCAWPCVCLWVGRVLLWAAVWMLAMHWCPATLSRTCALGSVCVLV